MGHITHLSHNGSGEDSLNLSVYFYIFAIISPWKRPIIMILITLNSLAPKDAFSQDWLKLAKWFLRRRVLNDHTPFSHFLDYLPIEEGQALCVKKLEFPSPKDDEYQV